MLELAQPKSSSKIEMIRLSAPSPVFLTSMANDAVEPGNFSISVTSVLISTPLLKSTSTVKLTTSTDLSPVAQPVQSETPLIDSA